MLDSVGPGWSTRVHFTRQELEAPVVVVAGDAGVVTSTIVDRLDDGRAFRLLITTWVHQHGAWALLEVLTGSK